MIFTDDKGGEYAFRQEGRNVWRGAFDGWLVAKAAESGAELLDGTAAIACEEENGAVWVTLQNRERCKVRARYLLDCEGVTGALKRKLAPGPAQYITTFQTFNEGRIALDPHYFYAYLQPELSEYDAWFNVKDGFLVWACRCGMRSGRNIFIGVSFPTWRSGTACAPAGRKDARNG